MTLSLEMLDQVQKQYFTISISAFENNIINLVRESILMTNLITQLLKL